MDPNATLDSLAAVCACDTDKVCPVHHWAAHALQTPPRSPLPHDVLDAIAYDPTLYGFVGEGTGGGCYAYVRRWDDGSVMLVTDEEGMDAMGPDAIGIIIGYYDDEEGPYSGETVWSADRADHDAPWIVEN